MVLKLPPDLEAEVSETAKSDGIAVDELVAKAVRQFLDMHWRERFEAEAQAFEAMRENLLKEYAGKFVAVYKGKVIDSDQDKRTLGKRVFARYGRAPIYFQQVTAEPLPAVRIRTPRFAKA